MKKPTSIIIYSNGHVGVFDQEGKQIPELQRKGWLECYFEYLEREGVDPTELDSIETIVNGRTCNIVPIKQEGHYAIVINEKELG